VAVFAVFDVETTGLSAAQGDRVVEIAAVILDDQFRVLRIFDSFVYPERTIPSLVSQIHGICTMQMARRKAVASNARLTTVASALRISSPASPHQAIVDAGMAARILSLLHETDVTNEPGPIQWDDCRPATRADRQMPRQKPAVSMQHLTQMGLTVTCPDKESGTAYPNTPDVSTLPFQATKRPISSATRQVQCTALKHLQIYGSTTNEVRGGGLVFKPRMDANERE